MTVTFYSNYINHHQIPFCEAMRKKLGDGFIFVETEPMEAERKRMGWEVEARKEYSLKAYESEENYKESIRLAVSSDIIIHGSAPEIYIRERIRTGKPAFRYSERFFKRGFWRILHPKAAAAYFWRHTRLRNYPIYMLCSSAYTAYDCARIFAYPKKCFRWGYFTKVKRYNADELFDIKGKGAVKLLWAGRFLDWKRPCDAVEAAKFLDSKNIEYTLDFIGDGEKLEYVRKLAENNDKISFLGSMSPEKVRTHMERADIFLFTSNYQEGWGAVLNEAMNSGCAVVSSRSAGAAPFLISHGLNGFMYDNANISELCGYLEKLAVNPVLRRSMGEAAIQTITDVWNPDEAANRLVKLCGAIIDAREPPSFLSGPCGFNPPSH